MRRILKMPVLSTFVLSLLATAQVIDVSDQTSLTLSKGQSIVTTFSNFGVRGDVPTFLVVQFKAFGETPSPVLPYEFQGEVQAGSIRVPFVPLIGPAWFTDFESGKKSDVGVLTGHAILDAEAAAVVFKEFRLKIKITNKGVPYTFGVGDNALGSGLVFLSVMESMGFFLDATPGPVEFDPVVPFCHTRVSAFR